MWLPPVRRSTSAARSSSAASGVTPTPLDAFSALAITRSAPSRAMRRGTSRCTAWRPGFPKTSPRKRTFTRRESRPHAPRLSTREPERAHLGHDGVERDGVRLARERRHDLDVEAKADPERLRRDQLERGVVVAAAAAE